MAFSIVWTNKRSDARRNEYSGVCKSCCSTTNIVDIHTGYLISRVGSDDTPTSNSTVHTDCPLPVGWYLRAQTNCEMMISQVREAPDIEFNADDAINSIPEPKSEPEPTREPTEAELLKASKEIVEAVTDGFLEKVPDLVRSTLLELTRSVEIKVGAAPKVKVAQSHKKLEEVVRCVVAGVNPFLVGPAGSGKTTLARQVAEVLKRKFYCENRVTSEFKLLGFMNAHGDYVRTQFRDAYEKGGVFLFDEVDASDPDALVALNSAIENGICPFPDKLVTMHKDFACIAAGNTFGRGADRQYVGRNQLDASTLDRFVIVIVDYDEALELQLAGNDDWTTYVQSCRKAAEDHKLRVIISPRASIYGSKLLATGMPRSEVEEGVLFKGMEQGMRTQILSQVKGGL